MLIVSIFKTERFWNWHEYIVSRYKIISRQTLKRLRKKIRRFYTLGEGVVVAGDVERKSRKGLLHYTRIVLDPLEEARDSLVQYSIQQCLEVKDYE
ncbi:hypothetical protein DDW10_04075 [Sulfolobales archaeon SCGC AB-777_J03]|nr:hypothetical protein DDW10_04075 [Sulfolobales archaeon SCGC AB-777_J03]